jgi:hypothetical protein
MSTHPARARATPLSAGAAAAAALLLLLVWVRPVHANQCYAATTQGTAPATYQAYCWLDFTGYSDTQAQSAAGQPFFFMLADGSSLTLTLHVSTNGASPALKAAAVPTWTGAAFGNSAFLGISGDPVLYEAQGGSTVHATLSNITVTPPSGVSALAAYGFVAADGESTNGGETLSFTTNGAAWTEMAQIPNGTAYPGLSGVGTATVTETGIAGTVGSYAFQTLNSPTQVSTVMVGAGLQGAIFGIRYGSMVVNSQLTSVRANSSDQFLYGVKTSGGTVIASAASSGTGLGPFTPASVPTIAGSYAFVVSESMSSSSVSPANYYVPSLTCTNAASGSSTVMPTNDAVFSYTFPGLQYQDAVTCIFSNSVSPLYVPNHFAVTTPGSAVNCQAAPVTVTAHTSSHTALAITSTITLGTSTGHGDWTLTTGGGTFTAGASNSGTATYSYVATDGGTAVFALRDTYPETVTVNVIDGNETATSGTALASEDSPLTFAPSGFITTNGNNVPTAIGTQVAGVASTQSLALQAVRTDTNTGACTAVFASGATVNVSLALQCNNPTACISGQTLALTNNGVTSNLAANPNTGVTTYTTVPLKFSTANSEAPITLDYSDAGQITLAARYNLPLGNGAASGNIMTGAAQFVVRPYTLTLSKIARTSDGFANPGSSTASGAVFIGAGQPFEATVSALNALGAATPNFGRETSPTAVTMTPALVLPASGDDPAVAGGFGPFSGGSASGSAFSWAEVGSITLTPGVANYLGSGALSGQPSGTVGRFVPNSFAVALNTPVFATGCSGGGFSYLGQPFGYTVAPVITVTAEAVGGSVTQNYSGSLFRLSNASLTGRTYTPTPATPALTLAGLPATSADPAIASVGSGQGTLTFSAGSGIAFARGNAIAPFNANIALAINVIDLDGVTAPNPVTFGAGGGIAFSTGAAQYYGRLFLKSAVGSELLDLPMSLSTQYYAGAAQGFIANTSDTCSSAPAIAFSNYQLNLTSGETCVRDSGSPGVSGQGCATAAASRYSATANSGGFNLILAAPGAGNSGALTVTATAPTWLQYLWNAGSGAPSNPSALATFGVFPGPATKVYQREVY